MQDRSTPDSGEPDRAPVEIPITGVLDLHTFRPSEVKELVRDYLEECRRRGILDLRIIHGKGTGALREKVHAVLRRTTGVRGFRLADESGGSWGATLVQLAPGKAGESPDQGGH